MPRPAVLTHQALEPQLLPEHSSSTSRLNNEDVEGLRVQKYVKNPYSQDPLAHNRVHQGVDEIVTKSPRRLPRQHCAWSMFAMLRALAFIATLQ